MRRLIASAALGATLSGCIEVSLAPDEWRDTCDWTCGDYFEVLPGNVNLLTGDSIRLFIFSTKGNGLATWTASANAVAFETASGPVQAVSDPVAAVTVKAKAAGFANVEARAVDPAHMSQVSVIVADSSAIARIEFMQGVDTLHLKVGQRWRLSGTLFDSAGTAFRGQPSTWTSGDPQVLAISIGTSEIDILGQSIGTTALTASFLDVRRTKRVVVVP